VFTLIFNEIGLVVVALVIAFTYPQLGSNAFRAAERTLGKLARKPRLAVLAVGLAALAGRAILLPIEPIPVPYIHDEFSHLLLADTLAHGRLANSTHPMWVHFETFFVIQQPSYASMYPPAQGLILAIGKVIFGHPFWGGWLSAGLMCAAICWMLQGWLPLEWALLGGGLAAMRFAFFNYWSSSYVGGAVAATGGALLLGALPRIKRRPRIGDALLMGLGLALLVNTRPYEGLVLSLPVAGAVAVWLWRGKTASFGAKLLRMVLPLGVTLALMAAATGYYNYRVTGSPLRMGYQVEWATYAIAPTFVWQSLGPLKTYRHKEMRNYYIGRNVTAFNKFRSPGGWVDLTLSRLLGIWTFYLGLALTIPLALLPRVFKDRRTRFLVVTGIWAFLGYSMVAWANAHYSAPATALIFALIVQGMRHLRVARFLGKPTGLFLVRAIPLIMLAAAGIVAARLALGQPLDFGPFTPMPRPAAVERARLVAELGRCPGGSLVLVRYGPSHQPLDMEWVYNRADIDGSKVVWARDMGAEGNAELLRYFPDRRVWLVEPDATPPRLSIYSATARGESKTAPGAAETEPAGCAPSVPGMAFVPAG